MARTKEFDYNTVLERATEVFLEKGYDNTSFQDLVDHMGIHRRSIYDTYGDKKQLYLKTLEKYSNFINQNYFSLINDKMSVYQKFEVIFNYSAFPKENCPKGCLFVNSAIELALRDNEISTQVDLFFDNTKKFFVELLEIAKEKKEISQEANIYNLASYLNNALIGIRVLVKFSPSDA